MRARVVPRLMIARVSRVAGAPPPALEHISCECGSVLGYLQNKRRLLHSSLAPPATVRFRNWAQYCAREREREISSRALSSPYGAGAWASSAPAPGGSELEVERTLAHQRRIAAADDRMCLELGLAICNMPTPRSAAAAAPRARGCAAGGARVVRQPRGVGPELGGPRQHQRRRGRHGAGPPAAPLAPACCHRGHAGAARLREEQGRRELYRRTCVCLETDGWNNGSRGKMDRSIQNCFVA